MKDFTIKKYILFLDNLIKQDYTFQTFSNFIKRPNEKSIVLRHDVDLLPENSLRFAKIQKEKGIKGTYYFRSIPESWDEKIILEIHDLGHEVGYHYETMDLNKGDFDKAWKHFVLDLEKLRKLVPVETICMHGSPKSKFNNLDLWQKYNYRCLGIIGEPYLDVNFNKVLYFTDTGRMWNGSKTSVRDKVESSFKYSYHTTDQLIEAIDKNILTNNIMFTFHPQRWHESMKLWIEELIFQNTKNMIKKYFFVSNK